MASEASSKQCAACKKVATKMCGGCRDTPLETKPTYYCNAQCQKADRTSHKALCMRLQTRRAFYRAGSTLQQIFYLFREILFDKLVVKIEEKGGKLYIHEGIYDLLINEHGIPYQTEIGVLYPFPSDLIANPTDKHAVLSFLGCEDALAYLSEIIKKMLEGIVSYMVVMHVTLQHMPRETVALNAHGKSLLKCIPKHAVLEVNLKHGERYILDLAGAQYGFNDPIIPHGDFFHFRVGTLHYYNIYEPSGAARKALSEWEEKTVIDHQVLMCLSGARINVKGSLMMEECTTRCALENKMSLGKMIQLPQAEFERTQKYLLQFYRVKMRLWLDGVKTGKYPPTV